MTAADGWLHDRFGIAWMLHGESIAALICVMLGLVALRFIRSAAPRT